ncbi:MAG: hypothetical protein KGI56_09610 [Acidobacteriota bacterium]|nr:hypothetical protein [Acidobacteriota bacterium]
MALSLDSKPMLPLYPVQPDRQPTYPKALGPVFVGNPLRLVPFAQAHPSQATPDLVGRFRPQQAEAHPADTSAGASYLQPASKDTAASRNPALGTRLDVLA